MKKFLIKFSTLTLSKWCVSEEWPLYDREKGL